MRNLLAPQWAELDKFAGQCTGCRAPALVTDCDMLGDLCKVCFDKVMANRFTEVADA